MKTNSIVTIERNGKTILFYINDCDWDSLPSLRWIVDVEILEKKKVAHGSDEKA